MTLALTETTLAGFPALRAEGRADRPPLLFLHGAFAPHHAFAGWMRGLASRGWRGVAPARRGRHGVGPADARGLRIADYVEDTLRVIDALGEEPVLIGHSAGGLVAQKVAEAGRGRAMVLLAPAPPAKLSAQPIALPAYLPMMPKILLGQPILPTCSACDRIALNRVPEAERAAIHDSFVPESGTAYREMIFGRVKVDASRVTCPTLVLGGRQDRIVEEKLLRLTADHYHGELRLYDEHAHWLLGEPGYERVVADAATWLEARFPARAPEPRGPRPSSGAEA